MAVLNAFNKDTAKSMQLDAGVIYVLDKNDTIKNALEEGTFTSLALKNPGDCRCIGATKGGATFSAVPEIRNILDGFNGVRGNYKGCDIVDSWEITLKTTMSELTLQNLEMVSNTGMTNIVGSGEYQQKITSEVGLIKSDKYKNIIWCGTLAGKTQPLVILLQDALSMNGVNIAATDKDSGSVEVEFKAHFTLCKDTVPYTIYFPHNEVE